METFAVNDNDETPFDRRERLWRPGRSAIEFYNCINTATSRQARTFLEFTFLFSRAFFLSLFFFFFRLPRARKRRCQRQGGTKKEAFSPCKIYDVQVSTRGRTSAELRVSQSESPENRRRCRRECPCIYFPACRSSARLSARSFLPPAMANRSRARAELIFKVPDGRNDRGLTFRACARFHEKRGLLIVRDCSSDSNSGGRINHFKSNQTKKISRREV